MQEDLFSVLGGSTLIDALGPVNPATLFIGVADVTPAVLLQGAVQSPISSTSVIINDGAATVADGTDTAEAAARTADKRIMMVRPPPPPFPPSCNTHSFPTWIRAPGQI